ncbi:hypothetical protein NEOLEDRAFT_352947 [Neolentinus lepideus HHB14362 ss-1]|uniref:Uncharacterized protein n=1 Tax=Neolentinus lepideus HHB14362 ss-1 TaxID=1314782 RepID=A0A165SSI4_9AGAM|nr:hypothetical protein NEOLEDRAFT_352947 [Neolentinus lepideus HHB14362 ss-1]
MGCPNFWKVDGPCLGQPDFCSCGSPNVRSLCLNVVGRCTLFMYSSDSSYCVLLDRGSISAVICWVWATCYARVITFLTRLRCCLRCRTGSGIC